MEEISRDNPRKGFSFLLSFYEATEALSNDVRLECLDVIIRYGLFNEDATDSDMSKVILAMAKPNIDSARRRYDAAKENGKKGGRPKNQKKTSSKPEDNQKKTSPKPVRNPEVEVEIEAEVDTEVKVELDIEKEKAPAASSVPKHETPKPSPQKIESEEVAAYFTTPKVNKAFHEFLKARKELKVKNTDRAVKLLVDKLKAFPPEAQYEAITESIMNGWKGVFPKNGGKSGKGEEQNPFIDYVEGEDLPEFTHFLNQEDYTIE